MRRGRSVSAVLCPADLDSVGPGRSKQQPGALGQRPAAQLSCGSIFDSPVGQHALAAQGCIAGSIGGRVSSGALLKIRLSLSLIHCGT